MHNLNDFETQLVSAVKGFAKTVKLTSKVTQDMSALIEVANQHPLSGLDYWERLLRSEFYNALELSAKANWKFCAKPEQILTWLDLISWDGYKRERTIRALSGAAPNSFFFTLAIRRLNDWVPQVREATREKLPLIADASNPQVVVNALIATLSNWNSWGRIGQSGKNVLIQIISNERIGDEIKHKIISSSSGPMPSLMAQASRTPVLDNYLSEIAEKAIQPSVRAKAFRALFENRMVWFEGRKLEWTDIRYCKRKLRPVIGERQISHKIPFSELLERSAFDASPIVKKVAAEFLIRELEQIGEDSIRLATLFASDKSSAVSERGKYALKKLA